MASRESPPRFRHHCTLSRSPSTMPSPQRQIVLRKTKTQKPVRTKPNLPRKAKPPPPRKADAPVTVVTRRQTTSRISTKPSIRLRTAAGRPKVACRTRQLLDFGCPWRAPTRMFRIRNVAARPDCRVPPQEWGSTPSSAFMLWSRLTLFLFWV